MSLDQRDDDEDLNRIDVIGAAAGGLDALLEIVVRLPAGLPAAVLVVMHVPEGAPSALSRVLARAGALDAEHASDGEALVAGTIRVAPPDHHLLVERGRLRVVRGPRENRSRPAVDALFRSAAVAYGPAVIGVVLSGALDDGAAGLNAIRSSGGAAIVQDPDEAFYSGMPSSALRATPDARCLPASEIGPLVAQLVEEPVGNVDAEVPHMDDELDHETRIAALDPSALHASEQVGTPSAFGCPDCGGVLWELNTGNLLRFRCRVGHAYSVDALLDGQRSTVEAGLWAALRALEDQAALAERLAARASDEQQSAAAERFLGQARALRRQAEPIRQLILAGLGQPDAEASTPVAGGAS